MDKITQILQYWGLDDATVTPIEETSATTWDVDGKYVLKKFRCAEDLSQSTKFTMLLASNKIPVIEFILTKSGKQTPNDELFCLMTKLPGKHVNFYENPALAIEMGRGLASLHIALANIEVFAPPHDNNLLDDWNIKIKPSLVCAPEDMVQKVDTRFNKIFPKLPRQLIHRDVHPQNILFEKNHISGWLDFDLSHRNVRIFDIAYFLAGLLIGNINDPAKLDIWREIRHNILQGYIEINPLTEDETEALPILMIVIELLFVWYWSEQGNINQRNTALEVAKWLYMDNFN